MSNNKICETAAQLLVECGYAEGYEAIIDIDEVIGYRLCDKNSNPIECLAPMHNIDQTNALEDFLVWNRISVWAHSDQGTCQDFIVGYSMHARRVARIKWCLEEISKES